MAVVTAIVRIPTGRVQVLAAVVLGALVIVGVIAAVASVLLPGSSDEAGAGVRSELTRATDDGTLASRPTSLRALTDFEWDRVWVGPPYDQRGVERLVGQDAEEVPAGGEFESILVFANRGQLAGWLRVDKQLGDRLAVDVRSCFYVNEPLASNARIQIQKRTLTFVTAAGRPVTDMSGQCALVDAPSPSEDSRRG